MRNQIHYTSAVEINTMNKNVQCIANISYFINVQIYTYPSKHDTLTQCCFNVCTSSATLG